MGVGTEPTRWPQPHTGSEDATLAWLDALAGGICTPEAFLVAMREQAQGKQDEGWEVLSLLDQYYRRGRIKAEVFHTLKSRLEGAAINSDNDTTNIRPHPSTAVTAPAAETRTSPAAQSRASSAPGAAPRPRVREVAVGDVLRNRYRVRGVVGHGGMGTVFEATDEYRLDLPTAGRRLAVKVLHTAVTQREELLAELQREFQHLQLLSHPNIVRVHEFDRDGEVAFFTMELLSGALLSRVLQARNAIALPRPYALGIIRDVGAALSHAHARGVIHGDINPQNIFVTNDGEIRVLDFGASHKLLPDRHSTERSPVATPGYASCQLLEGRHPDARDDLFAFACVAYLLLSGQHPFPKRTAIEARTERFRPRRPAGLTGQQWRVLREGLHWDREQRPADLQKWLDRFGLTAAAPRLPALTVLLNTPPPPKKSRLALAAAAVGVIALLAVGGYWAAINYDSLARNFYEWRNRPSPAPNVAPSPEVPAPSANPDTSPGPVARTMPAPAASAPAASAPAASAPAASAPAASAPAASAPAASSPAAANPAASRSAASSPAASSLGASAPAALSASTAASVPSATSAPSRTAAPAAALSAGSSARAEREAAIRAGNAGPIRVEMAADTLDVRSGDTTAHVSVRRRGNIHGPASFKWWTESGTAKPGVDFVPAMPHVATIEDGRGSVGLDISVSATPRAQPKSFYVVIDQNESGPALGARALTMVTLLPPD